MHTQIDTIINTCYATTNTSRQIAFYSHLIPVIFSLALAILVFVKSKRILLSKIFLAFVSMFSLWLIGDLILWTQNNYFLQYASWAPLDYIEIVFYVLGLYFAISFVKGSTIPKLSKIFLFILTLPPLFITLSKQSVNGFNYPVCEAFNNNFLGNYKLAVEGFILIILLIYIVIPFIKKLSPEKKKADLIVLGSMFLFLSIFGVTEYFASITGNYEMNLYSLFVIPIFLFAMIYSVFDLDIFNFKILGTHYLVVGFLVLTGMQVFFIKGGVDGLLTGITVLFAAGLSVILFRNLKKESDQRILIEHLADQRESFIHFLSHEVKGILGKNKNMFAMILEKDPNTTAEQIDSFIKRSSVDTNGAIDMVENILRSNDFKNGKVSMDMKPFDMKASVLDALNSLKFDIETKGLTVKTTIDEKQDYTVLGDKENITKHVIRNLIDNAIRYTPKGDITIFLSKNGNKVLFSVKDTGVGITPEDMSKLFTEGGRGKDSIKVNVHSTGYGLFFAKGMVEAHNGRVWAESEGAGKGTTFLLELPAYSA